MTENPDAALTPQEFDSLIEVRKFPLMREIPPEHMDKLKRLGFVSISKGEPALTEPGEARLSEGRPRERSNAN